MGHAIEKLSDFTLAHGECVVLGMRAALNLSCNRGRISRDKVDSINALFNKFDFPETVDFTDIEAVIKASKSDKKMDAGQIKFVLVDEIGKAYVDRTVSSDEMRKALEGIVING